MYASSLIIPMKKIETHLEKVESYSDFDNNNSISVGIEILSIIEDWSAQIEYAISKFNLLQSDSDISDQSVEKILKHRYNMGHKSIKELKNANIKDESPRFKLLNDHLLVPIDTTSYGIKNWHQTVQKLYKEFPSLVELSGRIHQRSTFAIEELNETLYWIIHDKLKCLEKTINKIYRLHKYITEYFNKEIFQVIGAIGDIANSVSKVNSNA